MKTALVLVSMVVVAGGVAFAQERSSASHQGSAVPAAEAVKARRKGLKALGAAFKAIRDELKGDSPDAAKIREASADIARAAGAIDGWFPAGSGPDSDAKTDAKPEVWTDSANFATAREEFIRKAGDWARISNASDVSAWKEGAASLGQSCKGCHDKYRLKKE